MSILTEKPASEFKFSIPADVLDDLCCRFIINVPAQEKRDLVRICFQVEQAHWFYLDFYSSKFNEELKPCGIKDFAKNIFHHIPYLRPFIWDLDLIIDDWKEYKYSVPTFGAIIIDEESKHILLVKSYWSKSSWGFPKGKINKDETPCHCAAREVYEETGFNISSLIHPNVYIETTINEQCVRLYIVTGVSKTTKFNPQTRNEIKEIKWFPIEAIPIKKIKVKTKVYNTFYMVIPFMGDLRKWLLQNGQPKLSKQRRSIKSFSEVEDLLHTTSLDSSVRKSVIINQKDCVSSVTCNVNTLVQQKKICDNAVEPECCYEGSDEDDVQKSNEEIYGIPKVKLSYLSGKELDTYLLTCSSISFTNSFHSKTGKDKLSNLDPSVLCLYENDLILKKINSEELIAATHMTLKSEEFKVLPYLDGSINIAPNNHKLSEQINNSIASKCDNTIVSKNGNSASQKHVSLEKQSNTSKVNSELNPPNNDVKTKGKTGINSCKRLSFDSAQTNSLNINQRFPKHFNNLTTPKNEEKEKTTELKSKEKMGFSRSYKSDYIQRIKKNKLIKNMMFYKFDRESLFKCLE